MKYLFVPILFLILYNCSQVEKKYSNPHAIEYQSDRIERFSILSDSLAVSFSLDTTFEKASSTFAVFGSDKSYCYTDKKDSVFITAYWNRNPLKFMDFHKAKEYLSGLKIIPDSIDIRNYGNRQSIKYTELLAPYYYQTCQVIDSTEQISFQLLYQTRKIDSTNIEVFGKICNSFSFEIMKK